MFHLTIYDANNWVRKQLEVGKSVRDCFEHIKSAGSPTIVVWDGKDSLKARRRLFPEYKAKRPKLGEDISQQFRFLEALVPFTQATSIRVEGFEADDVIAHLAKEWKVGPVTVFSTDKDLLQVGSISLFPEAKLPCHRDRLRLYKTLVGDSSDNIPGIPNFGPKTFEKIKPIDLDHLEIWFRERGADNALVEMLKSYSGPAVAKWLTDFQNIELLHTYWKIIGFLTVPEHKLNKGTTLGKNAPDQANAILESVFQ